MTPQPHKIILKYGAVALLFSLVCAALVFVLPTTGYHFNANLSARSITISGGMLFADRRGFDLVGSDYSQYGFVTRFDQLLVLHSIFRTNPIGLFPPNDTFYVVPWGKREYLIHRYQISNFVRAIHRNIEPRTGRYPSVFLLREGDETAPVEGRPNLPISFQSLLADTAILCTVTSWPRTGIAVVDIGTLKGSHVGLPLLGRRADGFVVSVDDTSSVVMLTLGGQVRVRDTMATAPHPSVL